MEYRTTDIRTGLFITFSIVAATVLIFLMGGVRGAFRDAREIKVLFVNARLLKVEAPVALRGFRVGEVTAISRIKVTGAEGKEEYRVEVKLAVDQDLDLREDATAMVKTDGLLGGKFVALTPGVSRNPLKDGVAIPGNAEVYLSDLTSMLENPLGRIDTILKTIEEFTRDKENVSNVEGILAEIRQILDRVHTTSLPRAEALLDTAEKSVRNVDGKVDSTLDRGLHTFNDLAAAARKRVDSLDAVISEARAVLADIRSGANKVLSGTEGMILDNNRNLYLSLRNIRNATAELDRLIRKVRADPSVVIWGDDEKVEPAILPENLDALRNNGRVGRYGKERGK